MKRSCEMLNYGMEKIMAECDSCGKAINIGHNLEYTGREVIMGSSPDIFGFQFRSNGPPTRDIYLVGDWRQTEGYP